MNRFARRLIFVFVLLLVLLPGAMTFAEPEAYREGIRVQLSRGFTIGNIQVRIDAVKLVDGNYRQSEVHFRFNSFTQYVDETFIVPIDADYLEASEDIGWGGLDATVWVTVVDRYTGETQEVPLNINLDLFATARRSTYDGAYFNRAADVRGTVTLGARVIDFNWPEGNANSEDGTIFTDQWPGR